MELGVIGGHDRADMVTGTRDDHASEKFRPACGG
jgi:hypothetical protein